METVTDVAILSPKSRRSTSANLNCEHGADFKAVFAAPTHYTLTDTNRNTLGSI